MRFFLFLLVAGAIALYFTNPSTDEVKAKLNGQLPTELSGAMSAVPSGVPADTTAPADTAAPADTTAPAPTGVPADVPGVPAPTAAMPGVPADVPGALTQAVGGEMQFERKDYYLFSVYKVSIGGQQTPGCIIGIAKQVVPYGKC